MKIAMVGQYPDPGRSVTGGVERVIDTLAPELAKLAEVALFVPGAAIDQTVDAGDFRISYIKRAQGPGVARYWSIDAWRAARAVHQYQPDIVHIQGMAAYGQFMHAVRVFTLHGVVDNDLRVSERGRKWGGVIETASMHWIRFIEDWATDRIGNVIAINPYVCEALPQINKNRVFNIPNPIDPYFCLANAAVRQPRDRVIITLGRVGFRKNTLEAIRVAACVLRDDASARHLIIGGADSPVYLQACQDAASSEGVSKQVTFTGNLSTEALCPILDNSSCLLMTSRQETAPLAISESNARGVAVVAPRAFGIQHMVVDGRNGLFLPAADDVNAKAAVLRRALDFTWDRAAIAAQARSAYSPETVARRTFEAYQAILQAPV